MAKKKIGSDAAGTIVPRSKEVDVAVNFIADNTALVVAPLTAEPDFAPEAPIKGAKTVTELMEKVNPKIDVGFTDAEGMSYIEKMKFAKLSDFGPEGIAKQSPFLTKLQRKKQNAESIKKTLSENKLLRKLLENPEQKANLLGTLRALLQEIEDNDSDVN
jgi:hypothetical protein